METISEEQVAALKTLMTETDTPEEVFLKSVAKTDGLGDILVSRYEDMVKLLTTKKTMLRDAKGVI
jgi:hypothetical protein